MSIQTSRFDRSPSTAFNLRGEADYRIAKSLTMISGMIRLRAFKGELADPQSLLLEIADRIDAVGSLHSLLAESISGTVQLSSYLTEICERGARGLSPCPVRFDVTCQPEHVVPFKVALPLGLITAELFSNSMRYADRTPGATQVTVTCTRPRGDTLRYLYKDNGAGLPDDFDVVRDAHLGMRLVQSLGDRMHGTYVWSNGPEGLGFDIAVPMA